MSEFAYINRSYGLAIKRGTRVEYTGDPKRGVRLGKVTSADGAHINIRFDDARQTEGPFHPTWELRYPDAALAKAQPQKE